MSIPSRLGAFIVDCLVACVPACLVLPVAGFYFFTGEEQGQFIAKFLLLWSVIPLAFFFLAISTFQISLGRPTMGRRIFALELVRSDGRASNFQNALRRLFGILILPALIVLAHLPLTLVFVPALGALLDKRGRAPWDLIAGTEVRPAENSDLQAAETSRSSGSD